MTEQDKIAAAEPALDCRVAHSAWGRDDIMALAAVRYCIGRSSYIVGDCVDWLHNQWPRMSDSIKRTIARDVDEAIARDDEARTDGREHKPLGWDCDRIEWLRAQALWAHNTEVRGAAPHGKETKP
ncbi:MAG: hypothetical protein ACYCZR_02150 [Burkholderiales bacterium]